jgi:2-polyprenyl-3-methyl-5-hydroxy-6-metoxy-1,4-benzoquinol methylase
VIGCGNAEFSENLYDDGYKNIYNIDICQKVVDFMKERDKERKEMACK